jgi:hypothetical protein
LNENEEPLQEKRKTITFCDDCNKLMKKCICISDLTYSYERDFKWEYAHERISFPLTQFREIMPFYD